MPGFRQYQIICKGKHIYSRRKIDELGKDGVYRNQRTEPRQNTEHLVLLCDAITSGFLATVATEDHLT